MKNNKIITLKKVNKKIFNNIQEINYLLFLFIFIFNIIFIPLKYIGNNILFLVGNFFILFIFFFINRIYKKEFKIEENKIKKLLNINDKVLYSQNDIFKLFKRSYLRKNIIEKDYKNLKTNFDKFIPEVFISNISKGLNEEIEIGISIEKKLHIMFIDISGFTRISENLSAEKSLFLLNIYFDGIVEISKNNGGYIDKFLGDGIMLIFDEKYSDNAVKTSMEIKNFVEKINIANFKYKIDIGIGINSGNAILGTIGSKERMDITIIGDTVNIASRIQDLTRKEKNGIIFSENTYNLIENKENLSISTIGKRELKGKERKIKLFGIY